MNTTSDLHFPPLPDNPEVNTYLTNLQLLLLDLAQKIVDDLEDLDARLTALGG